MKTWFDSSKTMKYMSMALLLLALSLIGLVSYGRYELNRLPSLKFMLPVSDAQVWLVFAKEIWLIDLDGHRVARKTLAQLDIDGDIVASTVAADGRVLIGAKGTPVLTVIDPMTFAAVEQITLAWPREAGPSQPLFLASAPNGDIAVSSEGQSIFLFARDGSFKAHAPPGACRSDGGIFNSPAGWWTTDTDCAALRLLDSQTLRPLRQIELAQPGRYYMLTSLIPSQGRKRNNVATQQEKAVATVARMTKTKNAGYVTDVFPDGRFIDYTPQAIEGLTDFGWFDGRLLVIDNEGLRIQRFNSARKWMSEFGDDELRGMLDDIRRERNRWRMISNYYLLAVSLLLLIGSLLAFRRSAQLNAFQHAVLPAEWHVGTPNAPVVAYVRFQSMLLMPALLCLVGILLLSKLLQTDRPMLPPLLFTEMGLSLLMGGAALIYLLHLLHRCAADPYYEPLLNRNGLLWLNAHDDWARVCQPGEKPCESTMFFSRLSVFWLLVTTRRLLLFKAGCRGRRLRQVWLRGALDEAILLSGGRLLLRKQGEIIRGRCPSVVTAERIASLLHCPATENNRSRYSGSGRLVTAGRYGKLPATRQRWYQNPWLQCCASAFMPGLGQFMQSRFSTGLYFFIGSGIIMVFLIFLIWTTLWAQASSAIPIIAVLPILSGWLVFVVIGIRDVWQFAHDKGLSPEKQAKQ